MRISKKCFIWISLILSIFLAFVLMACNNEQGSNPPEDNGALWGTVSGTVIEYCYSPVDPSPVAGVVVKAGNETATTDENGNYEIKVYAKSTTVSFEKRGYITQSKTFKKSSFTNKKASYDFIMYVGAKVQGVVKDKDGNALSGVTVSIGIQQTTTDSQGNFVFDEVIGTSMVIKATINGKTVIKPLYTEDMITGSVTTEIIVG